MHLGKTQVFVLACYFFRRLPHFVPANDALDRHSCPGNVRTIDDAQQLLANQLRRCRNQDAHDKNAGRQLIHLAYINQMTILGTTHLINPIAQTLADWNSLGNNKRLRVERGGAKAERGAESHEKHEKSRTPNPRMAHGRNLN